MNLDKEISIGAVQIGASVPLVVIAGPCVLESAEHALKMARALVESARRLEIGLVFKASFDKANRTSTASFRGPGETEGLEILANIKKETGLPILTDVHETRQVDDVAAVADCLQIPAMLCRQTDLIQAATQTGRPINVKKGQFMAPWDMEQILLKIEAAGGRQAMLTERGSSFGYNRLVVDMTSLAIMRRFEVPIVFDATHSVQAPGGQGTASGGDRALVPPLARAATAVGIDALFVEVHDNPDKALSDGPNSLRLEDFEPLVRSVLAIHKAATAEAGA